MPYLQCINKWQLASLAGVTYLHELPCRGVATMMHGEFIQHGNESLHSQVRQSHRSLLAWSETNGTILQSCAAPYPSCWFKEVHPTPDSTHHTTALLRHTSMPPRWNFSLLTTAETDTWWPNGQMNLSEASGLVLNPKVLTTLCGTTINKLSRDKYAFFEYNYSDRDPYYLNWHHNWAQCKAWKRAVQTNMNWSYLIVNIGEEERDNMLCPMTPPNARMISCNNSCS